MASGLDLFASARAKGNYSPCLAELCLSPVLWWIRLIRWKPLRFASQGEAGQGDVGSGVASTSPDLYLCPYPFCLCRPWDESPRWKGKDKVGALNDCEHKQLWVPCGLKMRQWALADRHACRKSQSRKRRAMSEIKSTTGNPPYQSRKSWYG